ncbi:unnamed protein product [Choristocarpus tenellus]
MKFRTGCCATVFGLLLSPLVSSLSITRPQVKYSRSFSLRGWQQELRRSSLGKVHTLPRGGAQDGPCMSLPVLPCVPFLPPQIQTAIAVNTVGFGALEATGKRGSVLTAWGAIHAYILGLLLWSCIGGWGWGTCVLYLALGSAVTKVKMKKKESLGIAEGRGGARGPENVWGSAATGEFKSKE